MSGNNLTNNTLLNATFSATNASNKSFLNGFFDGVLNNGEDNIAKVNIKGYELVNGQKTFINKQYDLNTIPTEYLLTGIVGVIKENVNGVDIPIPNVRVSFIKDFVVTDKTQLQYNGNKIVVDYDMTDENGQYVIFVEPGTYTIRVDGGKYAEYFTNQVISEGLKNECYVTIDGLIKSKHEDIIELCEYEEKIVTGYMIDQNDKPLVNAEIIISQGQDVITYIKTDEDGKYQFAIKEGIYNIRLRGPKQPVKIIYNYEFKADNQKGMFVENPITTGEYF